MPSHMYIHRNIFVYIYICIYIYMYIYIYTSTYIQMHVHAYAHDSHIYPTGFSHVYIMCVVCV